jgi:hypothetical protein
VNHFIEAYFVAHPDFAVDAGRHEFDGKLPDWSPAALSKEAERLRILALLTHNSTNFPEM